MNDTNQNDELRSADEMRIFISARSSDYGVASKLQDLIQGTNPNVEVHTGQNIRGGEQWYTNLLDTLKRSNVLIAIHLGEDEQGNYDWVYQEAGWFVREEQPNEPVIPLYPGERPPAGLDMYQGYSMADVESAKAFLDALFDKGLKGFKGINPSFKNLDDTAEQLVHSFAVGRLTPLVDLFPFRVTLNDDGTPADVRAAEDMPKKVGLLDERSSWDKFTEFHRSLPGHGITAPAGWVRELEEAFTKIHNGTIFKQPTQPLESAGESGERFLPVIVNKLTRDEVVESIGVHLVQLADQVQVGGRIFRVLALFEQLQSDVLSRFKKWGLHGTPTETEWAQLQATTEIAGSLIRELRKRAADVDQVEQQVIRIDHQTLAELLDYAGTGVPGPLQEAVEAKDLEAFHRALKDFDTATGNIWIATARAYLHAVDGVMGSHPEDD